MSPWRKYRADQDYIVSLFEEYAKVFLNTARREAPNPQDAEDIVQEAIIAVIQDSEHFLSISREKQVAFVVVVIRNDCIDQWRRYNRRREYNSYEELIVNTPDDRENFVLRVEAKEVLETIMSELKDDDRLVLGLRYVLEADSAEIARILGCDRKNVSMRVKRARERAFRKYSKEGSVR